MQSFPKTHHLLYKPTGRDKWEYEHITTVHLSNISWWHSCLQFSAEMQCCFQLNILVGRESSEASTCPSCHNSPHFLDHCRDPVKCQVCLPEVNYTFRNWRNNCRTRPWTFWALGDSNLEHNFNYYLIIISSIRNI